MASVPKGVCGICKVAQNIGKSIAKNYKLYAFFIVILVELSTLVIQSKVSVENYAYKLFPIFTYINFIVILTAIYLHAKKLLFCDRQKLILMFLILYYSTNLFFTIFPVCWSEYQLLIYIAFLVVILILFFLTWKKTTK